MTISLNKEELLYIKALIREDVAQNKITNEEFVEMVYNCYRPIEKMVKKVKGSDAPFTIDIDYEKKEFKVYSPSSVKEMLKIPIYFRFSFFICIFTSLRFLNF